MRKRVLAAAMLGAACPVGSAWASETPLYQPAPAWVKAAPPLEAEAAKPDAPQLLIYDNQQRIDGATVWSYLDMAQRVSTADALGDLGTVSYSWSPDKGDLIVHRVEIVRGTEHIDVLKQGGKFSVLRREEGLERRMLNGMLTATMPVEGLRVGDVLRVSMSTVQRDEALKGKAQSFVPLLTAPLRTGFARGRVSWPAATPLRLAAMTDGAVVKPVATGGEREVSVILPLAKPAELPADAPLRYRTLPLLEASSFADWADVSKTLAPLFATDAMIADGSPLAGETDAILKAAPDPLHRAELALELVQSKIRYLMMGMNGGNYVPEKPERTWTLRYGDCKAKTLLMLAMLRRMGIEAEPVLVSSQGGDMLPKRLASPGAFDHVLVRAVIAGKDYWLDGTGGGARIEDIADTPGFRYGLPLRTAGTGLMPIAIRPQARPDFSLSVDMDERAGVLLPIPYSATLSVRGQPAEAIATAAGQASASQKREIIGKLTAQFVGEGVLTDGDLRYDAASGIATVTATGLLNNRWEKSDRRYRQTIDAAVSRQSFGPDRARAAWQAIPVATPGPGTMIVRTRVTLPDGGRGFALEGDRTLPQSLVGLRMTRTATLEGGIATSEDRIDEVGAEIAPADLPAVRAAFAAAQGRLLRIVAPADYPAYWQVVRGARTAGALKPIDDRYGKAIANDPEEVAGYRNRAIFRARTYDREGALADWSKVIALAPDVESYVARSQLNYLLGQTDKAMADADAAYQLDPSRPDALTQLASLRAEKGDAAKAIELAQTRIDAGGQDKFDWIAAKAEYQSRGGDKAAAIATMDAAISERPGSPSLLNSRCWLKGTLNLSTDTALKDCTRAIELTDHPTAALDSRAMVYYRMGRYDDALADLDSALAENPDQAASLYMRGIVKAKLGKGADSAADLAAARFIQPRIDSEYKRYGIAP